MMFAELNASDFEYNNVFYSAEFENILSKVIACYYLMLADNVNLSNDENKIRDVLYSGYLNNNIVRKNLDFKEYYFDREVKEDTTKGRTDIRVLSTYSFEDTAAYYIIECKRLNAENTIGKSGLNAEYARNGICRFTSKTYSTYYRTNGMIGFIVQPIDISKNIASINQLLASFTEANTTQELKYREIVSGFNFSYCSTHNIEGNNVVIYHLMLDCSKNIQ